MKTSQLRAREICNCSLIYRYQKLATTETRLRDVRDKKVENCGVFVFTNEFHISLPFTRVAPSPIALRKLPKLVKRFSLDFFHKLTNKI